jgi:glycosyltransferase involved in cell wall biosynthesis
MRSDGPDAVTGDDVTVMVCAYNAADTIGATLASIAAQTVLPGRIIVLDDASTDATADVARRWTSRLPIEIVTHPENRGHPAARVTAQQHCRTPLIALVDADDFWLPDHLETMLAIYRDGMIVVARELLWVRGTGLSPASGPERDVPSPRRQLHELVQHDYLPIGTLFARADAERVGGFRDVMPEDWDLWIRMVRDGAEVVRTEHPTYVYRIHTRSSSFGDKFADANVTTLERALAEATSPAERRAARHGLLRARARQQLTSSYREATTGDVREARRAARRALRGGPRIALRAAFMLVAPRTGARVHHRRMHDVAGWIDA